MVEAIKEELEENYQGYLIIPFFNMFFISKIKHPEIYFLKVMESDNAIFI
jgi:hypothetical protein